MANEIIFRILVVVLLVSGLGVSIYFRHRADKSGGRVARRVDGRLFVLLQMLFLIAMPGSLLLFVVEPARLGSASFSAPDWLRWLGVAAAAAATPAMAWVLRHLGDNVTPTAAVREQHELVTSGPYRFVRHPLYSFGTLWWLGLSLVVASWWMLLLTLLTFVAVATRAPREEAALVERFGDGYRIYMERTPRYLPHLI